MPDRRAEYAAVHLRGPQARRLHKAERRALRRHEPPSMRPKAAAMFLRIFPARPEPPATAAPDTPETGKSDAPRTASAYMALSISISSLESSLSRSSMISSLS